VVGWVADHDCAAEVVDDLLEPFDRREAVLLPILTAPLFLICSLVPQICLPLGALLQHRLADALLLHDPRSEVVLIRDESVQ
jgi:hypothetical protein